MITRPPIHIAMPGRNGPRPERFAQTALGHDSRAVHGAYARGAIPTCPPLDEYGKRQADAKVILLSAGHPPDWGLLSDATPVDQTPI